MIEKKYKIHISDNGDIGFTIIKGKYKNVIIYVEDFSVLETGVFDVKYHILKKPKHITEDDIKSEKFETLFDMIIKDMITKAFKNDNNEFQIRDINSSKPDTQ